MSVSLSIECNADDNDDSSLKIEQWNGETHNGQLRYKGLL